MLGPLCSALEHGSPWVRHLSSRCLGMLARVCTGPTMSLVTGRLLAQLGASHDPILRQGALEALACILPTGWATNPCQGCERALPSKTKPSYRGVVSGTRLHLVHLMHLQKGSLDCCEIRQRDTAALGASFVAWAEWDAKCTIRRRNQGTLPML